MKDVRGINSNGNDVWAASTGGLFYFNRTDIQNSVKKFTSIDGLLSNELSSIIVDNSGNVWTGGTDGAISKYSPGSNSWRVVTDIQTSTEPSKSINGLFQYGNYMFFATEFSIVKFNISQFNFVDQPYIYLGSLPVKTPVYDVIVINDTIWAATKNGIAYANINNYLPIASNWLNFTTTNSSMLKNKTNDVAFFNNKIYFGTDSGMVYYDGTSINLYQPTYNGVPVADWISHMEVSNGSLYFSTYQYSNNIFRVDQNNINVANLVYQDIKVNSLDVNSANELLIGTDNKGLMIYANNNSSYIMPNTPFSNIFFNITVNQSSNVFGVSGSLGDWSYYSGIYRYDGTNWRNFTPQTYPQMGTMCCGMVHTYSSKFSNTAWASGWGNGLMKIEGDSLYKYDDSNSRINYYTVPGFCLVMGMCEDNGGNLWLLNNFTQKPIVNFTGDTAYAAPVGNSYTTFFQFLVIDNYNTKWMTLDNIEGSQRGVMYFNESANIGNIISYNQLGADISGVNGIIKDKNGEIWVATNNGIVVIPDPYQVISNPNSIPYLFKMRIIENGISTPLTENVQSIRTDALNNKWIGTFANGLLYVSPDGSTLISRYNNLNSPLPDNKVTTISSDDENGVIYFGTPKGLVSYQTIAVEPLLECDRITAGPNPYVIPNSSLLRIDGLVENSLIKILTISGSLVAEFETPGGRVANWDGRDLSGNYVGSGIYIIVGYNQEGSKVCTGKVAVIRQ